jgi:AcrR family transcriptional regulator
MPHLSDDTRRDILTAASKLFSEKPLDNVRMEDVAEKADIGKATIYRYFKTKDELYLRLLEDLGRGYLARLREAETSVRGCRSKLVALVTAAMGYFKGQDHLIKLLDRAGIDRDRHTEGFPWLDVQRQFFRTLQGLLAEGVARSEFRVDDLEVAVRALVGAMRFQFLYACDEVANEEFPEKLVGLVVRGVDSAQEKEAA